MKRTPWANAPPDIKITATPGSDPADATQAQARTIAELIMLAEVRCRVEEHSDKVDTQKVVAALYSAYATCHTRFLKPEASLEQRLTFTNEVLKRCAEQLLWAVRKAYEEEHGT